MIDIIEEKIHLEQITDRYLTSERISIKQEKGSHEPIKFDLDTFQTTFATYKKLNWMVYPASVKRKGSIIY